MARPTYEVALACPACGAVREQQVLRARQVLTLSVPGRPFERAFGWVESFCRTEDSPFYHNLCLCPECRYPGPESDFRLAPGQVPENQRSLQRLFRAEAAGDGSPVGAILGSRLEIYSEPERSLRLLLASLRAEMLHYPELWRRPQLGRLYLRLAWIYLDELHLSWNGLRPGDPPAYSAAGANRARMTEILSRLRALQNQWPEIPLDEEAARQAALRFHREVYQTRPTKPTAEAGAIEERQLAELYGLVGEKDKARELLDRAQDTCILGRTAANQHLQSGSRDATLTSLERNKLSAMIQRLARLSEEIAEQRRLIFGPRRVGPVDRRPVAGPLKTVSRPARRPDSPPPKAQAPSSEPKTKPAVNSPRPKRRFRLFG